VPFIATNNMSSKHDMSLDLLFFIPIFALFVQALIASLLNLWSPFWLDEVIIANAI
jgi:hypothetical protein